MRVVGVMDLQGGRVVHAVRGERERYRPLRSRLCADADPVGVARAFRDRLGLAELYVADLDALAGGEGHAEVVAALAREAPVLLDAGASGPERVAALLALGVDGVVVGTETLPEAGALSRVRAAHPAARLVLSLDLGAGRVLSRAPGLAGRSAAEALEALAPAGIREVIALDLARVGSGEGPDLGLVAEVLGTDPGLRVLAGGGVRDAGDLRALRSAGAAGALVATALHAGAIGPAELRALR